MANKIKKIFGIDLGTTYSAVACVDEHGKSVIIPNAENQSITPSVVFFDGEDVIVGDVAKENTKLYPNEIVSLIKRSMADPNFLFEYKGKDYRPEEISAYILRKLIKDAEQELGEKISDIVITCPAYFGINEREATRLSGEIAGLTVRQVLNEPTAAAIAYGTMGNSEDKVILVYDLGGGTFDITMIHAKPDAIDVICTGGDKELGGKDWDDRMIQYLVDEFQVTTGCKDNILEDIDIWQELQLTVEKAKKTLSQREKAPILVTYHGERAKIELTRKKFEEITQDLLDRTISLTHDMLNEAKRKGYHAFDDFILVGGSTRMPQVLLRVQQEFSSVKPKLFSPDEAVAKGAAIFAWKLSLNDELSRRVTEYTEKHEIALSPLEIPEEIAQAVADEAGFTLEAVKYSKMAIRNVTSKSFGVLALNQDNEDRVVNLVLKNTTVPTEITDSFGTHVSNQETVEIKIMESDVSDKEVKPENAIEIGTAILSLPPNLQIGSPIEITFLLNGEGRLEITAFEVIQARQVSVTIDTSSVIQGEALEKAKERSRKLVVY
ncbi:MAG: Hsp70 family protein [Thiomargarita sp.]|nr:Hsp70 family protein [Thiomargarita sp.]